MAGFLALNMLKQWQFISTLKEFKFLAVLTSVHEIGTLLTNMSTSAASASFMHTVKVHINLFMIILVSLFEFKLFFLNLDPFVGLTFAT